MAFRKKVVVLCVIFVFCAVVFGELTQGLQLEYRGTRLELNFPVLDCLDVDIPGQSSVIQALKTDVTVFKRYLCDASDPITLYVGYYRSVERSKLSHAPQVCFTGQGWVTRETGKGVVRNGEPPFHVNRLVLEKGEERILVYFWYQSVRWRTSNLFELKLRETGRKLLAFNREMRNDNAFVRVSIPLSGRIDEEEERLENFANKVADAIDERMFTDIADRR